MLEKTSEADESVSAALDAKLPAAHKVPAETEHIEPVQLSLFGSRGDDIIDELNAIDISNMTPLQALNKLQEIKKKAEG